MKSLFEKILSKNVIGPCELWTLEEEQDFSIGTEVRN